MNRRELLHERNASFAARYDLNDVTVIPRLSLVVLTCLDPRVDPAHFWGLTPGDAKVIRNAGGRVTDAVIEDLAFVSALLKQIAGAPVPLELAIVLHTECGAGRLADADFRAAVARESGLDPEALESRGYTDHRLALETDMNRLRSAPLCPIGLHVSGHVYDVRSGRVMEVIAATDVA